MSLINISDLNSAGIDLFADSDSFLSDLQETESTSVHGGKSKGGHGYGGGYGGRKSNKSNKSNKGYGGYGYGGGYGCGYGGNHH